MKEGWEYKKLGEVCDFFRGLTYSKNDEVEQSDNKVLRSNNIDLATHKIYLEDIKCVRDDLKVSTDKKLKDNSILICMSNGSHAHLGKTAFVSKAMNYAFGGFMGLICPKNKSVFPKFCFYATISKAFLYYIEKLGNGANIKNLKWCDLQYFEMSIPPLSEQQAIVEELDLLNAIIDKKKEELEELDKLSQSIFYDMFGDPVENEKGWEMKKIKDVAKVKIGPFGSLLHAEDYVENGYPVINPIHMSCGKICPDMNFTINEEKYSEMSVYVLHENDIVFGRRGDIGRCALVTKKEAGYICGTGSLFVRFAIEINPLYSLEMLQHSSMKKYLISKAKGATMLNINCGVIEQTQIPLPPLPLQQEFAARISSIEQMKDKVTASMAEVQTLLAATMDKYFG